jgi:superkiller protein 3
MRWGGIDLSAMSVTPIENLLPVDRLYEASLVKAVQIEPRNYYYRDFLGYFYLRHGFQDRALAHFQTAVRLQPVLDRHFYLSHLATVSPAVLSAAEAGIKEALKSEDTETSAEKIHNFLAAIYLRMGRPEEARGHFEAVATLTEHPAHIEVRIGQLLVSEGDDQGALEAFRRATEHNPDYAISWIHLGQTLSRMGRHDEALQALEKARGLKPADFRPAWALAVALEESGRPQEAAEILENAIKIHKDERQAYIRLIGLYEQQGRLSQALRVARQLAAHYPGEYLFEEQVRQLEEAMLESP